MSNITIKVNEEKYLEIKNSYDLFMVGIPNKDKNDYIDYVAKVNNVTVTGYLSKKKNKSITFSGVGAKQEASRWVEVEIEEKKSEKKPLPKSWVDNNDQIGSDEVGVGDFLLPMIVVASYVKASDIKFIKELGVKDSKKLTDIQIREIAPKLVARIEYSKLTLSNEKYNEMALKRENINSLKAKMHNRALANLVDKHPEVNSIYVDQFASIEKYYEYLDNPDEKIVKDITFHTKGESYYPSVAVSSIIARYAFLLEVDKLNEQYKMKFPFGANKKVDEFARSFIERYGINEFNKIAKKNFANYKTAISAKLI